MKPDGLHETEDCRQISELLSRVGDKWSMLIVSSLGNGRMRFSDLRRRIGGISQKMLTASLRNLERDGFVKRTVHDSRPPQVDYELTDLGHALLVPVSALADWTRKNQSHIEAARRVFDRRSGSSS